MANNYMNENYRFNHVMVNWFIHPIKKSEILNY